MMLEPAFSLEDACRQAQVIIILPPCKLFNPMSCAEVPDVNTKLCDDDLQEMINQVSRQQREAQGHPGGLDIGGAGLVDGLTRAAAVISQKKEQSAQAKHSIHSKLTRLYFERLAQAPQGQSDSVLVG